MSRLHICNTFFERELKGGSNKSFVEWIRSHPIFLQLQFLPLLYARKEDRILVSDLPDDPDPRLCLIEEFSGSGVIEHWGPSLAIDSWAKKKNISYSLNEWKLIQKLNSKVFSFTETPRLAYAELLESNDDVERWIRKIGGPKVLKTPFGTAGNGHIHIENQIPNDLKFPLIAEPWVERVYDFSTQWNEGELLGVTLFENEPNGTYLGTRVDEVESWALEEHLSVVRPLIEKIKDLGYSGSIGIDAFVYLWNGEKRVHPVVEINGRKTMSWVALQTPEKCLYYAKNSKGLLPEKLTVKGKTIHFCRNVSSQKFP